MKVIGSNSLPPSPQVRIDRKQNEMTISNILVYSFFPGENPPPFKIFSYDTGE